MMDLRFEWDSRKAKSNVLKHRVTFTEAETVFYDENGIDYPDPDHSQSEDRFILLGLSVGLRVLVVSYCYQDKESVIRIISARKATKKEARFYGEQIR